MKAQTGVWIAIIAIVVFAGIGYYGINQMSIASEQQVVPDANTGLTTGGQEDFCANNPSLDLGLRALDVLSTETAYLNATFYLKDLDKNVVVEQTIDDSTGNFDTFSNILRCGNPKGYEIVIKTTQDGINAEQAVVTIKPEELFQDPVTKTIETSKHTLIKAKAYDNANKQVLSVGGDSAYQNVAVSFNETGSDGTITIGADGYLDVEFTLAPQSSNEAGGKEAIVCVNFADDSNVDDWDENSIDISFEGTALSEATLSADDAKALSAYENCYALPHPVGKSKAGAYDSISNMRFYIQSQAGVNPDFDPVIRYVELGNYLSSMDNNKILRGVASKDNSARTFIGSATASTITVDIV